MTASLVENIKNTILELGRNKLELFHISPRNLPDRFNLIESGVMDSLEFLELLKMLETRFRVEIDLGGYEPGRLFEVSGLARLVAACVHAASEQVS